MEKDYPQSHWLDDIIFDREHEEACEAELEAAVGTAHQLTYRDYALSAGKTLPDWIEMRLRIRKMMIKFGHSADEIDAVISKIQDPRVRFADEFMDHFLGQMS